MVEKRRLQLHPPHYAVSQKVIITDLKRKVSLFRCRKSCVFEAGDTGLEWGGEGGLQQPALRSVWLHAHRVLQQVRGLGLTLPLQAGAGQDLERETGKIYL